MNIAHVFYTKFLLDQPECDSNDEADMCNELKRVWSQSRKMCLRVSNVTLRKLISRLNAGQGHDQIHSIFLKNASDQFLCNLAHFYNMCFVHCYLPISLLKGTITPVLKDAKKNVTESSNYRPVMQSSCLLKIFELHVLDVLSEKLVLNFRQFGFRAGSSTTDACFVLKEVMFRYSKRKRSGLATFIDLSKAFDRVDHFLLCKKMLRSSIPVDVVLLILHYLRNQQANVNWKNSTSNSSFIEKGVRQGGILSPFLFNLYLNDIIDEISDINVGCCFGFSRCNIIAYADDLVLLAETQAQMIILFDKLTTCIDKHFLKINKDKTKCVIFSNKMDELTENIELNGQRLQVVKVIKYLGHKVTFNFKDTEDIAFRLQNFYASSNSIFRDFAFVDKQTLLFLFKSFCLPDYGIPLWNHHTVCNSKIFKTLDIAFSKALKRICGVPVFASNHITAARCDQLLFKHHAAFVQARYCKRLLRSCHPILRLNVPHIKDGFAMLYLFNYFKNEYNVNVFQESLDIIKSRIHFIQNHERRRSPCLYYGF